MNEEAPGSQHYKRLKIEPLEYIIANGYGPAFCVGNIIKYVSRYQYKKGLEDLRKAKFYIEKLIELVEIEEAE